MLTAPCFSSQAPHASPHNPSNGRFGLEDPPIISSNSASQPLWLRLVSRTKKAVSWALFHISKDQRPSYRTLFFHPGVADYKDYRDSGNYTNYGVNLRQAFTSDTAAVQSAINSMYAVGGYDLPESQLKAI